MPKAPKIQYGKVSAASLAERTSKVDLPTFGEQRFKYQRLVILTNEFCPFCIHRN